MSLITYRIDSSDHIETVSEAWDEFAASNQAALAATDVIGQSLWRYVADATTRQVYRDLNDRVRAGRTVTFAYRCDSPALRRFMRMTMTPGADAAVIFASEVIRTEAREPIVVASPLPSGQMITVCSWCKRVAVADSWLDIERAVDQLQLMAGQPPSITHGMCPECVKRVSEEEDAA